MTPSRVLLIISATALVGVLLLGGMQSRPDTSKDFSTQKAPSFEVPIEDRLEARFVLCDGRVRVNCVVDGDTIWVRSEKIRIADIDAPEIFSPRCGEERSIGKVSRDRLLELLNGGSFTLVSGWRDTDRFGRKLRTVTRHGKSLGEMLVREGLARRWNWPRRDWCARDGS
ncbi:thermonuclease family protein [Agrobacterium larrymoorei]|uniref:Thermonuclease family protein n=2 Tax=Agrobacterium larrymoorei TaxID=160699 RepID=A0A4D7E426_9HYPH|nr:thermonuclease family protein [Agrobacterium larrymoorei]QCJ00933.1 thermonuclease family protein [Agrobacterium larrymoorei]